MNMPSTVADTLNAAADLLSKPGAWTQGAYSRSKNGSTTSDMVAARPTCWCILGALAKVTRSNPLDPWVGQRRAALDVLEDIIHDDAPDWNDYEDREQDEVVAKLREAAAKARGEVQP